MKIKFSLVIFLVLQIFFQSHSAYSQEKNPFDNKSYFTKTQISETNKIKVFNNLWETINQLYFDSSFNGNDWAKLRNQYQPQILAAKDKIELKRILNKLVSELKTSHLYVSFEVSLNGKTIDQIFDQKVDYKNNNIIFGYGYSVANFDNQLVVTEVFKNSSAEQVGIKVGWIEKSCRISPSTNLIGDSSVFSETAECIFSTETEPEKKVSLSQSWFLVPHSNLQPIINLLTNEVLYLGFKQFGKGLGKWLKKEIANSPSAKTIILDLRGNKGGLIDELKESLSLFFPSKTVIGEFIERDLDEKTFRVGSDNHYKGQIIVLIDGNSYSCAEIFASAFLESGRGKVIGQKSGGQVLASLTKSLSNGFKLQIAYRDYRTQKGQRLETKGVTPNIEIPFSIKDFRQQHDVILEKTLEMLKNNTFPKP